MAWPPGRAKDGRGGGRPGGFRHGIGAPRIAIAGPARLRAACVGHGAPRVDAGLANDGLGSDGGRDARPDLHAAGARRQETRGGPNGRRPASGRALVGRGGARDAPHVAGSVRAAALARGASAGLRAVDGGRLGAVEGRRDLAGWLVAVGTAGHAHASDARAGPRDGTRVAWRLGDRRSRMGERRRGTPT